MTMTNLTVRRLSFCFLIAGSALGQGASAVAISVKSSLGNPTTAIVTNGGPQVLTGFVLVLKRYNSAGVQKFELQRFYDPFVHLPEHGVQPGESVEISLGSPFPDSSKPDNVQLMAAVFADGKTFGDNAWAGKILRRRFIVKNALQEMIAICEAYTRSESGGTFGRRFDDYQAVQSVQMSQDDLFVFQFMVADAKANLGPADDTVVMAPRVAKLLRRYQRWKGQIESSLPKV